MRNYKLIECSYKAGIEKMFFQSLTLKALADSLCLDLEKRELQCYCGIN